MAAYIFSKGINHLLFLAYLLLISSRTPSPYCSLHGNRILLVELLVFT